MDPAGKMHQPECKKARVGGGGGGTVSLQLLPLQVRRRGSANPSAFLDLASPKVLFNPRRRFCSIQGILQAKCTPGRGASGRRDAELEDTVWPHLSSDTQERVRSGEGT